MKSTKHITFANTHRDFNSVLNKRVNQYFKSKGISRHANAEMVIKTICMFLMYFVPYGLIVSNSIAYGPGMLALVVVMGFGLAGIGLSVMHDANHGAYSKKKWINNLLGYSLNLVGASAFNWKMQHNVLHHSYTNIHEEDEDISPRGVLRLNPHSKWKAIHRYQHLYAWFLYGLMTLVWLLFKDFYRIHKYHKIGLIERNNTSVREQWAILILTKIVYIGYMIIIPVMLTPLNVWQVLGGILLMHYIAGFVLAIIFQPAHVIEGTEFPLPDENRSIENNWAVHQLITTTNFANNSRIFSWYVGGLNFQIEHHLFPSICHVHYRHIAPIVQQTAQEFGLPYRSEPTFLKALLSHKKLLKQLGMKPSEEVLTTEPTTTPSAYAPIPMTLSSK